MNKRHLHFACVLFLMAAFQAGSAQEQADAIKEPIVIGPAMLNNTTSNISISNTTSNESIIAPYLPQEIPAANETLTGLGNESEPSAVGMAEDQNRSASADRQTTIPVEGEKEPLVNQTLPAENLTGSNLGNADARPIAAPGLPDLVTTPHSQVFTIGGGASTPELFPISGEYLPREAYEVGLPAKTVIDLSEMPFYFNRI